MTFNFIHNVENIFIRGIFFQKCLQQQEIMNFKMKFDISINNNIFQYINI